MAIILVMWNRLRYANSLCGITLAMVALAGQFTSAVAQDSARPTPVVKKYLRTVERSSSFSLGENKGNDTVLVGHSITNGWRVIVLHRDNAKSHIIWDSQSLKDPYFTVTALESIQVSKDQPDGYIVAIRGCMPHQCADGKIGFAVYASRTRQVYVAHVTANGEGSYSITRNPEIDLPTIYRDELDKMICTDYGISHHERLPFKCHSLE